MKRDRKPLPRFWYLPNGHRAAVVMTGDDHANNGTSRPLQPALRRQPGGLLGRELGVSARHLVHVPADAASPMRRPRRSMRRASKSACTSTPSCLTDFTLARSTRLLHRTDSRTSTSVTPILPAPVTKRHHCIVWSDWATGAKVQLANGIRLDTTYYYWPRRLGADRPGSLHRLGDADALCRSRRHADRRLPGRHADDRRVGPAISVHGRHAARSRHRRRRAYGVYTVNAHTDDGDHRRIRRTSSPPRWSAACRSCRRAQMLTWLDGRNGSSFGSMTSPRQHPEFHGDAGRRRQRPARHGAVALRATALLTTCAAAAPTCRTKSMTVKGFEYAVFPATSGSYARQLRGRHHGADRDHAHAGRRRDRRLRRRLDRRHFSESSIPPRSAPAPSSCATPANALVPGAVTYDRGDPHGDASCPAAAARAAPPTR